MWTFLDRQICAQDELHICKVRLQLKDPNGQTEEKKTDKLLKSLTYTLENKNENVNLISVHEVSEFWVNIRRNIFCYVSARLPILPAVDRVDDEHEEAGEVTGHAELSGDLAQAAVRGAEPRSLPHL